DFIWLGNALMFAACVLTLWSMFYYLKMAAKEFKQPRPPEAG
ncbi:MAG: CDP-diacylglycerol--glycerol-3-phosphate 3-phosphatidyltransferase, partial [Eikenella corrodens]|nr:CDP-diacylglycerol--glycerol-3-phosphate 3-phosphatidyltransferase [Eikenella corrodens]